MNPKITKKQKELALLNDVLTNLQKCNINRNDNNDYNFAGLAVENAIFNIKRVKDLIEGIL